MSDNQPQIQPQPQQKSLRPNPFITYRDPETGAWVVVKPVSNVPVTHQTAHPHS